MTNFEKYKTAQERAEVFYSFCVSKEMCDKCPLIHEYRRNINECRFAWLDLEAEEEKPSITVSNPDNIQIGDTVAYRTMDDNKEEWACFTVRAMDNEYFYENTDHSGDNIAKGCCYKVNVNRVIVDEDKTLPCPFCKGRCEVRQSKGGELAFWVACVQCGYRSNVNGEQSVIKSHNRVAKAVKESEVM